MENFGKKIQEQFLQKSQEIQDKGVIHILKISRGFFICKYNFYACFFVVYMIW